MSFYKIYIFKLVQHIYIFVLHIICVVLLVLD